MIRDSKLYLLGLMFLLAANLSLSPASAAQSKAQTTAQATFASPDDAMQALISAAKSKDRVGIARLLGPDYNKLLSGDPVEDDKDLSDFATAADESAKLQKDSDAKYTLVVGSESWPTPIPIVQKDGQWLFDTKAGLEEVLDRQIGENELAAIETCRAYALAQWEYYVQPDPLRGSVAQYAQKFVSSPGKHDGLYWETAEDEDPSPLGELVAQARSEGYGPAKQVSAADTQAAAASNASSRKTASKDSPSKDSAKTKHIPYYGYYFKILTRQGPHAPGGRYSYIINGNMIAGYALVAYPDKWGSSGVMTFIVSQQGRVYQKNLGPNTAKVVGSMSEYDPDPTWKLVEAEP